MVAEVLRDAGRAGGLGSAKRLDPVGLGRRDLSGVDGGSVLADDTDCAPASPASAARPPRGCASPPPSPGRIGLSRVLFLPSGLRRSRVESGDAARRDLRLGKRPD